MKEPKVSKPLVLSVQTAPNDVSAQLRIQRIRNGWLLKTGDTPVYYENVQELAAAVSAAIINTPWPNVEKDAGK